MNGSGYLRLAERMEQLPPYLFGVLDDIKAEKIAAGEEVIDLGLGNPSEPPPESVVRQLCASLVDPAAHRYPKARGAIGLRREIAAYYHRDYGVRINPDDEVLCTIGSKEGLSHLFLALTGRNDAVIVPSPTFPIHRYAVIIAGGTVSSYPISPQAASLRTIDALCRRLGAKAKVLLINYPHNPTGEVASVEFLHEMVQLAKKHQLVIVHDFAYGKITFDNYSAPSFMQVPGARDVGVEFGSFSKSYNMAGWRIGYCVGNREVLHALAKIKGYYDYGIFSPIQMAGQVALSRCGETASQQSLRYQRRRDIVCSLLRQAGWHVTSPKGGMFVWAKIPEPFCRDGSMRFALEIGARTGVFLTPGIGFGPEGEGYVRIALVENRKRLQVAICRIRNSLLQWQKE